MASLLFNWKVWVAVGIGALIVFLYLDIQAKKLVISGKDTQIATLDGEKTSLTQERDSLLAQIASALSIIETLKANVTRANKALKEMEFIRSEANDLRRQLIAMQDKPLTCPELEAKYEDYSIDVARKYNSWVHGKVRSMPAPADSASPDKAMPNSPSAGVQGSEAKAH
jgi:hypothetical protein